MKTLSRYGAQAVTLLFISFSLFFACNKRDDFKPSSGGTNHPSAKSNDLTFCDSLMNLVQFHNGVLQFQNVTHMSMVLQCLENQVESWNSAFDTQYGNLSEEAVDSIIDAIGFNEDQPLIDFENRFSGFVSMRNNVANQVNDWLDHTELDPATDPEEANCVADDEEQQAVLNTSGQVMIGSQLISFCSNMGNTEKGEAADRGLEDCHTWGKAVKYRKYENDTKQFKLKVALRNYGITTAAKSKVVSFKKKGNGKWKRYRTSLFIQVGGQTEDPNDCSSPLDPFGNFKGPKKRRRLLTRFQQWLPAQPIRCKTGDVWGFTEVGPNQAAYTIPIIW